VKGEQFMATPISGGTAFDFGAAAQATTVRPETTAPAISVKQPAKIVHTGDTVRLSPSAQVRLLKTQGQTAAQIAISLALSSQTVDGYLGIAQAPLPAVVVSKK
jgi:hypothetical protein